MEGADDLAVVLRRVTVWAVAEPAGEPAVGRVRYRKASDVTDAELVQALRDSGFALKAAAAEYLIVGAYALASHGNPTFP